MERKKMSLSTLKGARPRCYSAGCGLSSKSHQVRRAWDGGEENEKENMIRKQRKKVNDKEKKDK